MSKWGKADFKELKNMQEKLHKLSQSDIDKFTRSCAKELAARLLRLVKPRTPVGKKPEGIERPDEEKRTVEVIGNSGEKQSFMSADEWRWQYWDGYVGGTLRRSWTATQVYKDGDTYTVVVHNPTEYASYVEYGHRQTPGRYVPALGKSLKQPYVKGKYMLTISERELDSMTPAILEKKLNKFLAEVFKNG